MYQICCTTVSMQNNPRIFQDTSWIQLQMLVVEISRWAIK